MARAAGEERVTWMDGWWAYAFIAIAGWLATDIWRWLGVLAGNRLRDDSEALNWVRAVATHWSQRSSQSLFFTRPAFLRSRHCGFGWAPS